MLRMLLMKTTPEDGIKELREEISHLKHQLALKTAHNRAMSGCLKLIAALPVVDIGCYYELRTAHRLAIKGAWHTSLGQNDHIFIPASETRFDQRLHSSKAHMAEAKIRRETLAKLGAAQ